MRIRTALFSALLAVGLLVTGCFDEVGGPYDGPDRIGFAQSGGTFSTVVPDEAGTIQIPAQLIGPQRSNSFEVGVSVQQDTVFRERQTSQGDGTDTTIVDTRAFPTTAEPSDYSVPEAFTFPSDTSNVTFGVDIENAFPAGAPADTSTRLTLRLEPNDEANVEVAENWRYFEITISNQ